MWEDMEKKKTTVFAQVSTKQAVTKFRSPTETTRRTTKKYLGCQRCPTNSKQCRPHNFVIGQWIGLRENLQENPIFTGKIYGFL